MPLYPASGVGNVLRHSVKVIRLHRHGCTNRPFYQIVVTEQRRNQHHPVIEQVGSYDPMPNELNEKLVSFNFERVKWWLGNGVRLTKPVSELLGLSGFLPIHPMTYMRAWRHRRDGMPSEKELLAKSC